MSRLGWTTPAASARGTLLAALAIVACTGDGPTTPASTASATIVVKAVVTGNALSPSGFGVFVAGEMLGFTNSASQTITNVTPGPDTAIVFRLSKNCFADSLAHHLTAVAGQTVTVQVAVECIGGFAYARQTIVGADVLYLDENGQTTQLSSAPGEHAAASWSPDGKHLVITIEDQRAHGTLDIAALDGTLSHALTTPPANATDIYPTFSHDGTKVMFCRESSGGGVAHIMLIDPSGTNERALRAGSDSVFNCDPSWSPDDSRISMFTNEFAGSDGYYALATVAADGTDLKELARGFDGVIFTGWSPNGRLIAVAADLQTPFLEQLVGLVPAAGGPMVPAWPDTTTSYFFHWSPDGSKLALAIADVKSPTNVVYSGWVINSDGTSAVQVCPNIVPENMVWSSDGSRLLTNAVGPKNHQAIYICRPDGSPAHLIVADTTDLYFPLWNPLAKPGALDKQ